MPSSEMDSLMPSCSNLRVMVTLLASACLITFVRALWIIEKNIPFVAGDKGGSSPSDMKTVGIDVISVKVVE